MTPPVIDWASRAQPWRTIGPAFRAECEAIAKAPRPAVSPHVAAHRRAAVARRLGIRIKDVPSEKA